MELAMCSVTCRHLFERGDPRSMAQKLAYRFYKQLSRADSAYRHDDRLSKPNIVKQVSRLLAPAVKMHQADA